MKSRPAPLALGFAASLLAVALGPLCLRRCAAEGNAAPSTIRSANDAARSGDLPRAISEWDALFAKSPSPALLWNRAQASAARGELGETIWALVSAREIAPADRAVVRELDRVRESAGLDPAELDPEPTGSLGRAARRFRLDVVALALAALSIALHGAATALRKSGSGAVPVLRWSAVGLLVLACGSAVPPIVGAKARPLAVVVHRDAPLVESASPTAESVGTLREGEVVPVLESSAGWLRIEDSSGARGWAVSADVRPVAR